MLRLIERIRHGEAAATLTLPLDLRVKARLRVRLDDGREAGLFLDRGPILRGGDLLRGDDGSVVEVRAANEPVSVVRTDDAQLLARACYHLGNRHTQLQILLGEARYSHDHVLDNMLRGLGLRPDVAHLPFEPEPGAYGDHAHGPSR